MAEQDPFGKNPPKKKSLSEELLKDDFFKPPIDDIYPTDRGDTSEPFPEIETPSTKSFLEEDLPISPLDEPFDSFPSEDEPQVKVFAVQEEEKRIEPKKIALIAGGGLLAVGLIIVGVILIFGGKEQQSLVPAPVAQPLVQAPAPTQPPAPPSPLATDQTPPPSPPPVEPSQPPAPSPPKQVAEIPAPPPAVARPAPPPPVAKPAPVLEPRYTLEVGRYDKGELASHNRKLARLGLSSFTITEKKTTEVNYVVVDQRFDEGEARAASMKVEFVGGIKNDVLTQNDGSYTIRAGPYNSLSKVVEIKNKISELGYATRIDFSTSTDVIYRLRVGKFATKSDAEKTLALLRQNGFSPVIKNLK
ncbi:MAG: SPOR domain-containing protein [Deltaproteobacteria bacterium]|nr:MAG: SPOR domain-containing protein [Deltaproteobacteria bacterium]